NAADSADPSVFQKGTSPLESVIFGSETSADVQLKELGPDDRLIAYRYHELILFKNLSSRPVMVRGRVLAPGEFCRICPGRRVVTDERVIAPQPLHFYINEQKTSSLPKVYVTVAPNDEFQLEKTR